MSALQPVVDAVVDRCRRVKAPCTPVLAGYLARAVRLSLAAELRAPVALPPGGRTHVAVLCLGVGCDWVVPRANPGCPATVGKAV